MITVARTASTGLDPPSSRHSLLPIYARKPAQPLATPGMTR